MTQRRHPQHRLHQTVTPSNRWVELLRELTLVGCAVLLYFAVRGLTESSADLAIQNGHEVLRFERWLGIDVERDVQALIIGSEALTTLSNWVYIWLHWPLIAFTLIWLHHSRRLDYLRLRNAMFVSGAIGLLLFAFHPVAPPRLLNVGLVDTVTELSASYRALQPPSLINKFAAIPSLHVGWNLLVGITLFKASEHPAIRFVAVASPIAMAIAVVSTANHFVVDGIIGVTVSLLGLAVASKVTEPIALFRQQSAGSDQREVVKDDAGST